MKRVCLFMAIGSMLISSLVYGQSEFNERALIPSSTMAAVIVRPQAILAEPSMELAPHEIITAVGVQELGFDPCKITKAMILVDSFQDLRRPPGFALVLAFDSDQSPGEKLTRRFEKGELNGKVIYRTGNMDPAIYQANANTIVFGMEPFIKKMIAAKGAESELLNLMSERGTDSHVSAFVTIEPVRGLINDNLPPRDQLPFPFQSFRELPDLIEAIVIQMDFSEQQNNQLEIVAIDEESAGKIQKIVRDGIQMGRSFAMEYMAQEMGDQDPVLQAAVQAYGNRVGDYLEANLEPKQGGKSLIFEDKSSGSMNNAATIGVLVGMLLPAVQQVREAARRTSSMNNLRQFALASLNYESAHRVMPGNIVDKNGKRLLSWRVAILPFMEENALYEQFHLDESWDSEHNLKLLDQMPAIYSSPNLPPSNRTVYLAFEGEETMFSGEKINLGKVTDGTSNTILFVEANQDAAIEWSRPKDIEFDPDRRVTEVGDLRPGGFNVVFCDGSVHFISKDIDWKVLSRLIQKADGEATGFDW